VRGQVAPLAYRQVAQHDFADAHAFEADHLQADQLAHTPDLAFFAFGQHKTQLLGVLPLDQGRLERLAIQAQAVTDCTSWLTGSSSSMRLSWVGALRAAAGAGVLGLVSGRAAWVAAAEVAASVLMTPV